MSSSNVGSPSLSTTSFLAHTNGFVFDFPYSPLLPRAREPSVRTATQIRIILNDAAVSFAGVRGCPEDTIDGLCPVEIFVKAQQEMLEVFTGTDAVMVIGPYQKGINRRLRVGTRRQSRDSRELTNYRAWSRS